MKIIKCSFIVVLGLYSCITLAVQPQHKSPHAKVVNPNSMMLPNHFLVYISGTTVINHPMPGFTKRILFTNNHYRGYPGCYIACYSHTASNSVYQINTTTFVKGQIRVAGHYQGTLCQPGGYVNKDISASPYFKKLCNTRIKSCQRDCWAGGATGGWFGIQ